MSSQAIRYAFLGVNTFLNLVLFFISTFLLESLTLFIIQIIALGANIIYLAVAVITPPLKDKKGRYDRSYDRAWGELVYVAIQWACWTASLGISAYNASQSQCRNPGNYKWAIEWPDLVWNGLVDNVGLFCRGMIAMAVLSGLHILLTAGWFCWLGRVVRCSGLGWGEGMRVVLGRVDGRGREGLFNGAKA
ncbi:hypothetical protein I316_06997 [Kwoniella heveanensis BCC8398]|uniref:MARVEL domain-containing protein n=1 Tax=Kwoniella heveanensis BCC8398 TaxID=1296120 RepID=A0A1B9GJW5_9TREE|nr:hypothetical protein I316_06997 [Kwoniella heveanensis BCC8398]